MQLDLSKRPLDYSLEWKQLSTVEFATMHTSSLINIEKILNRPVTKFQKVKSLDT